MVQLARSQRGGGGPVRVPVWHCTCTARLGPTCWPTGWPALLATPLADPFAHRGRRGPGSRHRAVAVATALPPRSGEAGHRTTRPTVSAPGSTSAAPWALVAEITGTREEDPWSPDALAWPLLEVLDDCLDEPWAATLAAHLGHGLRRRRGRPAAGPAVRAGPAPGRPLRVVRRPAARRARGLVRRPRHRRVRRPGAAPTSPGSPSSGGAWSPAVPATRRRSSGSAATLARLRDRPRTTSTCRPGCRCSATPGCPSPTSSCWRRWRSTATSTSGCRTPRRRSGQALADAGRDRPVPRRDGPVRHLAGRPPAAGLASAATCASCSGPSPDRGGTLGGTAPGDRPHRTRCSAGSRPTSAATPLADRGSRALDAGRPVRSRCTPATGRRARSRCCARCSSACSPTTRPSSRATSW